jgi:hypothetical protein
LSTVVISIPDLEKVIGVFQSSIGALQGGFRRPLMSFAEGFHRHVESRFDAQAWAPWAQFTIVARSKRIGWYAQPPVETNRIGIWTGGMFRSLVSRTPDSIFEITDTKLEIGTHLDRAVKFHFGIRQPTRPLFLEQSLDHITASAFGSYLRASIPVFHLAERGDPAEIK